MVRRQESALPLEGMGARVIVADLKYTFEYALDGCKEVISAAGAGMNGDPDEVDYKGVAKLVEAAQARGVRRFILISSMGTTYAGEMPEMLRPFLEAKRKAEEVLEASEPDYTVIQPGGLTDGRKTGKVAAAKRLDERGSISRADVASVAAEVLRMGYASKKTFEVLSGDVEVDGALRRL